MTSPFDDPEVRAQMARMGVAHQPGMAADLMKQLAPLLAEDGIDLDDLGDTDRTTFETALARATERHNLALFTPIGRHRDLSMAVLRVFAAAVADDDQLLAEAVLAGVPRDETDDMPAGSHVIGTALGFLDTRLSDRAFASVRPRMRVPGWPDRAATAAARDIVPLANKGRAFDALNSLTLRHGGKAVMDGAALAVAAALVAEAHARGIRVSDMAEHVLPGGDADELRATISDAAKPVPGAAFRRAATGQVSDIGQVSDAALAREYATWLREVDPDAPAEELAKASEVFEMLLEIAADAELDMRRPDEIVAMIDEIVEVCEDHPAAVRDTFLFALDDYLHFQLAVSPDPSGWEVVHDELESELAADDSDISELLQEALTRGSEVDPEVQHAALLRLPVVSAVPTLLDWVGNTRPITPSGGVRRADIAEVAAMIGIDAVGVAKRVPAAPGSAVQVTTMFDLTVLTAWWEALQLADVIELSATRVRPGRRALEWAHDTDPTFETAEMVAGMVASQILTDNYFDPEDEQEKRMLRAVVPLTLEALSEEGMVVPDASVDDAYSYIAGMRVARLAEVGLAELPESDVVAVPLALVGAVSRALMVAMALQYGLPPGFEEPGGTADGNA